MTRFRRFLGAVLVAGSSTQCLLLTESPNVSPSVQIEGPTPGPEVLKGKEARFTARVTDDQDPNQARLAWYERDRTDSAPCPTNVAEAVAAAPRTEHATSFPVIRPEGRFCVWVVATDPRGARNFAAREFNVVNMAPTARIAMVTPSDMGRVPLFSEVEVTGGGSEDPDDEVGALKFEWQLESPPGVATTPARCGNGTVASSLVDDGPAFCRRLDAPGAYKFKLTVKDPAGAARTVDLPVTVQADAPPCIERTEPPHDLARDEMDRPPLVFNSVDRPYTFRAIEVKDDGDPFPSTTGVLTGSFVWRYRDAADKALMKPFVRLADTTQTSLTFAANTRPPGDEIEVRLEYRDRRPVDTERCGESADRCQDPPGSACYQKVSWRLRFIQ